MESLPRLPSESGIIDIQWKRRVNQKNAHLQAKVDPTRIFNALEFLKTTGNKHYQTAQNRADYEARCRSNDPEGFRLIFGDEENVCKLHLEFIPDGSPEPILELPSFLILNMEHELEQEFQEKDVVRKYQIDYNETVCMVERFPEAMQTEGVVRPSGVDNYETDAENLTTDVGNSLSALCQNYNNTKDKCLPELCQNKTLEENQLHVSSSELVLSPPSPPPPPLLPEGWRILLG